MSRETFSPQSTGQGAAALRASLRMMLPLFGRVEVHGAEHLREGGHLLVCNHVGWADPIWIAYAVQPRLLHQMAKRELFRPWWAARLLTALGAFPVDRARPSAATLKYAVALLQLGSWLLIFPTGTRNRSQTEARRGAAVIAAMAGASIVPVNYQGPDSLRLRHLLTRPRIVIRFGAGLDAGDGGRDRRNTARLTEDIGRAVTALVSERPATRSVPAMASLRGGLHAAWPDIATRRPSSAERYG